MENENKTSFWDKKEGTWGIGLFVIGILSLFLFSSQIGAGFLVLATTLGYGIAWSVIGILAFIILHGLFIDGWLMLRYQVFCKNLRKMIIDENPITVLRILKEKADKRMKEIRKGKDEVKGRMNETSNSLNQSKREFLDFQKLAKQLSTDPDRQKLFKSTCGKMAIAADLVKETAEQLAEMTKHYNNLNEAYTDLEAMKSEMEYRETALVRKFKNAGALDKVWGLMRGIVKGETEDDRMHEEVIASINEQFAARMGRVESAMDDCKDKFDEIKTKREISENEGVEMFNQLANINIEQLTTPSSKPAIGYNPAQTIDAQYTTVSSQYSNIIKK